MKKLKSYINILMLFFTISSLAQQETLISNYWSNMNLVNPAYVGSEDNIYITSTIRDQWSGIENAPVTQMFSYSSPTRGKVGYGLSIVNDETFVEKNTYVAMDYSYKLKLEEETDLYFGLKAGFNFYSVDTSNLQIFNSAGITVDPSIQNISDSYFNVGIGFLLKRDQWYLSASVPRMLNREQVSENEGRATMATDIPHFYFSSGYEFDLKGGNFKFIPSAFLRYVRNAPTSIDVNFLFDYRDSIQAGFTLTTESTYGLMLYLDVTKNLEFGYAYENSSRKLLSQKWTTNEFFLRFKFPYKKKLETNLMDEQINPLEE